LTICSVVSTSFSYSSISLRFLVFPFAPQSAMQGLGRSSRGAQTGTAQLLHVFDLLVEQAFGLPRDAGEHAHAVDQQPTSGRVMDLGLHTRGIQAQLAAFGHFRLDRQLYHPIVERVQGFRAQGASPANESSFGGYTLEIDEGLTSGAPGYQPPAWWSRAFLQL
jgi:hypothetical protein